MLAFRAADATAHRRSQQFQFNMGKRHSADYRAAFITDEISFRPTLPHYKASAAIHTAGQFMGNDGKRVFVHLADYQFGWIYFVATMDAEHGLVALAGILYAPAVFAIATLAFRRNAGPNFRCIVFGKLVKLHARIIEPQCPLHRFTRFRLPSQNSFRYYVNWPQSRVALLPQLFPRGGAPFRHRRLCP